MDELIRDPVNSECSWCFFRISASLLGDESLFERRSVNVEGFKLNGAASSIVVNTKFFSTSTVCITFSDRRRETSRDNNRRRNVLIKIKKGKCAEMHFLYQEKIFFIIENRSVTSRMLRQSQQLTARTFSFFANFSHFFQTHDCTRSRFVVAEFSSPQSRKPRNYRKIASDTSWKIDQKKPTEDFTLFNLFLLYFFAMHISRSRLMLRRTPERNKAVKNFSSLLSSTSEVWSGQHQESTSHCCCAINFVFFRERWDWAIWLLG